MRIRIDAYKNKDDREISAPLFVHADSGAFIEFAKEFVVDCVYDMVELFSLALEFPM